MHYFRKKHCLDKHALRLILNTLVLSHVNYGILVWGSAAKTALQPLTVMLKRIVRCVNFHTRNEHIKMNQLYKGYKILQIKNIYHLEIAKFMYKYTNNKLPSNFLHYFTNLASIHFHNTRLKSSSRLFLPRTEEMIGYRALLFSGVKIWRNLSLDLKQKKSLSSFSKAVKQNLLRHY